MRTPQTPKTSIANLSELTPEIRNQLLANHRGFIRGLARELGRDHSHVSKHFNGKSRTTSLYIETALLRRCNELLAIDAKEEAKIEKLNRKPPRSTAEKDDDLHAAAK